MTTPSESDPFVPGATVGPYHLLREIGRGGMGRVLLARDSSTGDRLVAIKVLLADPAQQPLLEARFQREVRNLARLRHPGIVSIFNAGSIAGHPFLAMDHVAGRDLRAFFLEGASRPGTQRVARMVRVMAQVARAVDHAHASGIAHRDIKPSNILVRNDGDDAVLLDFGISKCLDDLGLTGIEVPGTALYMAPEQLDLRRHAGDHLIDVWALGVTLYFALTGELPFKGDSPLALSHDVVFTEPEPPTRLNGRISPDLETIVLGCMRKDASRRIQSASEVARLLEATLEADAARLHVAKQLEPGATLEAGTMPTVVRPRTMVEEPTLFMPSRAGSARIAAPTCARRTLLARALVVLVCLGTVPIASDMRVGAAVRAEDLAAPPGAQRALAATAPSVLAGNVRLGALVAEDAETARSVLLYTADIDVASRRNLLGALHALAENRPGEALPRLREFVRHNPKSPLLALTRFWIATALLVTGRIGDAAREYDAIVAGGPHSQFAPRALLFQATAHAALGDRAACDRLLERLAAEYPGSLAAQAADEPLPSPGDLASAARSAGASGS